MMISFETLMICVKSNFQHYSFHPWREASNDWVKGYDIYQAIKCEDTPHVCPDQWVSPVTSTSGWEKSPSFSEARRMIEQTQSVCVFFQLIGKCVYNSIKELSVWNIQSIYIRWIHIYLHVVVFDEESHSNLNKIFLIDLMVDICYDS